RNPYNTSIHLYQKALSAKKNGSAIITIDPRRNETSKIADFHISVSPSGDGALAMAITKIILEKGWENREFIERNIVGFEEYVEYLNTLDINYLLEESGVEYETAQTLAELFQRGALSAFIGYGMQKYYNGGNSIRAIDALLSITGNVGEKGAGAFYANRVYSSLLNSDPYGSEKYATSGRNFWVADFVGFIRKMNSPDSEEVPVKAIFLSKCNPLNQYPNLSQSIDSFREIEFKVCIDMFMTDTAKECDLFIPCSNTLETEDIIYSSMHCPNLIYNEKVVEPENKLMDEFYFFRELAKIMGMKEYPQVGKKEYLNRVLEPLDLDVEKLKNRDYVHPVPEIAWEDKIFSTPSGKIEIYSDSALRDGQSPIPVYISGRKREGSEIEKYPYRFLTPHYKNSLFSQHFMDVEGRSKLYVSWETLKKGNFQEGESVKISSDKGEIVCEIYPDSTLRENLVYMYVGWNHKHGNPNFITQNGSSEMGGQVTYNETFINIEKI
ncbi:MAG: molybdopterin-dependent oxidoreductase, partial [Fusobacteriaceae bacterium]